MEVKCQSSGHLSSNSNSPCIFWMAADNMNDISWRVHWCLQCKQHRRCSAATASANLSIAVSVSSRS